MNPFRNPIENLEQRRLLAATIKSTDVRTVGASDGTKENANDVVVKFTLPATGTLDVSKMRMFGYANNTITGGQVKMSINIISASIDGVGNLVLRTDAQVRKGSQITLSSGAVKDSNNENITGTIRTKKGLNRDRFTLALRAFEVGSPGKFSSEKVTGGGTSATANTEPSSASIRAALVAFLGKKVSGGFINAAKRDDALARFDDAANATRIPSANLRAAIVSLVGTVGEPAINHYLAKANTTGKDFTFIGFDGAQISSSAKIVEGSYTNTGRAKLVFNPNYAGESFVVLSGILAHETIHESGPSGAINSQDEEIIANFVEATVYAQQIVTDFSYSDPDTMLVHRANYRLFLVLNSGDRQFPRVGVARAPLQNNRAASTSMTTNSDYPNANIQSFEADIRAEFTERQVDDKDPTPSNPTARTILTNITGNAYDSSMTFGKNLIKDVDIGQDTLSDAFAMRVARVLQVKIF